MNKKRIRIFLTQIVSTLIIGLILFKWQNSIEKGINIYREWMNNTDNITYNVTSSIEISNLKEWDAFVDSVQKGEDYENCKIILNTDIDFKGRYIRGCIGTFENPFKGVFDGNNHVIKNINISSGEQFVGLFGYTQNAIIENLKVINGNLYSSSASATGGIVGYTEYGMVIKCVFNGLINFEEGNAGGIIGDNSAVVNNCRTYGKIKNIFCGTGGIVGNNEGTIYHCENNISINGDETSNAGGIAGYNCGLIESSVNYENIKGGGIVAWNRKEAVVRGCFNFGNTYSGIVDVNSDNSVIEQCVQYGRVSGRYAANISSARGQSNENTFGNKISGCLYLRTPWMTTVYHKNTKEGKISNNYSIHQLSNDQKNMLISMLKDQKYSKSYELVSMKEQKFRKKRAKDIMMVFLFPIILIDIYRLSSENIKLIMDYRTAISQEQSGNYEKAIIYYEKSLNYKNSKMQGIKCIKKYIQQQIYKEKNIYLGKYNKKKIEWLYVVRRKDKVIFLAKEALFTKRVHHQEEMKMKWEETELYEMLNNEWKELCLNDMEQEIVCEVSLISVDDAYKYLNNEQKRCKMESKTEDVLRGINDFVYWWIRDDEYLNSVMPFVTASGLISKKGKVITFSKLAIRPIIVVNLKK